MDAVGRVQLTMLEALLNVLGVLLALPFHVWFLDTTARRCVIMGNGETDHASVGEVDRTLDKSLSECTTSHNLTAVLVLDGSRHNL